MVPASQPPQLHSTRVPIANRSVVVATSASLMYILWGASERSESSARGPSRRRRGSSTVRGNSTSCDAANAGTPRLAGGGVGSEAGDGAAQPGHGATRLAQGALRWASVCGCLAAPRWVSCLVPRRTLPQRARKWLLENRSTCVRRPSPLCPAGANGYTVITRCARQIDR